MEKENQSTMKTLEMHWLTLHGLKVGKFATGLNKGNQMEKLTKLFGKEAFIGQLRLQWIWLKVDHWNTNGDYVKPDRKIFKDYTLTTVPFSL